MVFTLSIGKRGPLVARDRYGFHPCKNEDAFVNYGDDIYRFFLAVVRWARIEKFEKGIRRKISSRVHPSGCSKEIVVDDEADGRWG